MKARVTVTIDRQLLSSAQRRAGKRSRSQAIELALRTAERVAEAEETIAYYRALTPREQGEDREWAGLAAVAAAALARADE